MLTTLLELLKETYPEAVKVWDGWDYKILSPISLDDAPSIQVNLISKKGPIMQLKLQLAGDLRWEKSPGKL